MTDWGALYRDNVAALAALADDLTDEQLATTVPASPLWTVRDVIAHEAGGAADIVSGRMDGAPGPDWTARHVAERGDRSVPELVAEIRSLQDGIEESLVDNPFPAAVFDIAVHHADVHEALGLPRLPDRFWLPVAEAVERRAGGLAGAVAPYDLFRGVFSRRSRAQMQAWGTGLTDEELDAVCIFGPREDDQPLPA